jgi:hypothetical protein
MKIRSIEPDPRRPPEPETAPPPEQPRPDIQRPPLEEIPLEQPEKTWVDLPRETPPDPRWAPGLG